MSKQQVKELAKEMQKDKEAKASECVKVVIRCRPMSEKEMKMHHEVVVNIDTKSGEIFVARPNSDEPPK